MTLQPAPLHHVPLRQVPAQPWRNGGGVTRELLAWPGMDAWVLRVSVATIDRSGPFSAFAGVDRWFQVLSGAGVRLSLPGLQSTLTPTSPPTHFAGEDAPACELLDAATQDLNLMTRRGAGQAAMALAQAQPINGRTRWRGLFAAQALTLEVNSVRHEVEADSLVWCDSLEPKPWRIHGNAALAWWLTLRP